MNKLFKKIATLNVGLAMAIGAGVAAGGKGSLATKVEAASPGTGYTKITSVSSLSTGDKVIIYNDNLGKGVTGMNTSTNKDVTISSTSSEWIEYEVTIGTSNFTLKTGTNYIYAVEKVIKYGTATDFTVNSSGVLQTDTTTAYLLQANGSHYRPYKTNSGYSKFFVYKVNKTVTYTVSYEKNAGSDTVTGMPNNATGVPAGSYTLSTATPSRSGYTFLGWGLTSEATQTVTSITVDGNETVYAIWQSSATPEVTVSPTAASGYRGQTVTLTATPNAYITPTKYVWTTTNSSIAKLGNSTSTTVETATNTIVVTYGGDEAANAIVTVKGVDTSTSTETSAVSCAITVTASTHSITLSPNTAQSIAIGGTVSITATSNASGAYSSTDITATSSDPAKVKVDGETSATKASGSSFVLSGIAAGTTTVTFATTNEDSQSINVTVEKSIYATYQLVTDSSQLEANEFYVIGASKDDGDGETFLANNSNTNNRTTTTADISQSAVDVVEKTSHTNEIMVVKLEGSSDAWKFKTMNYGGTDGYFYNPDSNNNYLHVGNTQRTFTISINSSSHSTEPYAAVITATSGGNRRIIRKNSTSPLFSCYSSGQNPVYLYKLDSSARVAITAAPEYLKIVNDTGDLDAEIRNPQQGVGNITFSSSDSSVIEVTNTSTGAIKAKGVGTATITASATGAISATKTIRVLSAHTGLSVGNALTLQEAYNFLDYLPDAEIEDVNYYLGGNVTKVSGTTYYLDDEFDLYNSKNGEGVDLTEISVGVHIIGYGELVKTSTPDYYQNTPTIVAVGDPKLDSVTISGQTTLFAQDAPFVPGGTLTAHYTQEAPDQTVTPTSYKYGASGIDPTTSGTTIALNTPLDVETHNGKYIYVLYTENNITKYCSFQITVTYASVSSVVLDRDVAQIGLNSTFDTSIVKVTINPSNANKNVSWSVVSNTVNDDYTFSNGLLTSKDTEGTITLRCESVADSTKYDEIVVSVISNATASFNDATKTGYPNHQATIGFVYGNIADEDVSKITITSDDPDTVYVFAASISIDTSTKTGTINIAYAAIGNATLSIKYDNGSALDTLEVSVIADSVDTVTWSEPSIDVFSGATLSTTGWNVQYKMASGDTGTASNYTIKLGSATVAAGYKFTAEDDGKTLHVEYGGVSSSSVNVTVTQTINSVTMDVSKSDTYTFADKNWGYSEGLGEWSGNAGNGYSNNGVQVLIADSPLTVTGSTSYSDVTSIEVVYHTNKTSGSATLTMQIGNNASQSQEIGYDSTQTDDGRTYDFKATYDYSTKQSGVVKFTVDTDTNSVYICSITIKTASGAVEIANKSNHKDAQRAVVRFAKRFNAIMSETSYCTTGLDDAWDAVKLVYDNPSASTPEERGFLQDIASLSLEEQEYAKNLIRFATVQYSDDSGEACVERMMKTYEVCVQKHGKNAFMSDIKKLQSVHMTSSFANIFGSNPGTSAIVIIISSISVAAIGGYFFLRKKKED